MTVNAVAEQWKIMDFHNGTGIDFENPFYKSGYFMVGSCLMLTLLMLSIM